MIASYHRHCEFIYTTCTHIHTYMAPRAYTHTYTSLCIYLSYFGNFIVVALSHCNCFASISVCFLFITINTFAEPWWRFQLFLYTYRNCYVTLCISRLLWHLTPSVSSRLYCLSLLLVE